MERHLHLRNVFYKGIDGDVPYIANRPLLILSFYLLTRLLNQKKSYTAFETD